MSNFVAVDNPTATRLTVHILAAVAEDEARRISERTKAALAAARRRGTLLGSARPEHWEGRERARRKGAERGAVASAKARRARAIEAVADLIPTMREQRAQGASLAVIAATLNGQGHTTSTGSAWGPMAVKRALDRAAGACRLYQSYKAWLHGREGSAFSVAVRVKG